jgi:hypothetical protein
MRNVLIASVLILAAAMSRLVPHPANVAPIAAMALAGGVYLDKRWGIVVPLAAMLLSDAIIGFHGLMPYVYGSFAVMVFLGMWLKHHKSPSFVFGGSLASSLLFFVVTNFGVWFGGSGAFYPKTAAGLVECYVAAIPFFRNTLLGDLAYVGVVFGAFEVAKKYLGSFQSQEEAAVQARK